MQPAQIEILESIGVDLEITMERFIGNENLYFRCISKFLNNAEYAALMAAIEEKDSTKAFEASHSLKGVVANLGFDNLFKAIKPLVEVFRAGSMDYDSDMLNNVVDEYQKVIDAIQKLI